MTPHGLPPNNNKTRPDKCLTQGCAEVKIKSKKENGNKNYEATERGKNNAFSLFPPSAVMWSNVTPDGS